MRLGRSTPFDSQHRAPWEEREGASARERLRPSGAGIRGSARGWVPQCTRCQRWERTVR